jgi:glycosyltransferase involved in cell wall biosynthesis
VDIFERLCDTGVNSRLLLLGYGQEWEKIQQQVAVSRWTKKIELPGFTDGEELVKQKLRMHVGVMPGSNWYGAPNKIFEYGAAGMAVLAPDTPTITDLFKNNEISLFEWNNANDAFVKLQEIVQSAELRARLQHNLQQHIRLTYSAKNTENFYLGVFKATGV